MIEILKNKVLDGGKISLSEVLELEKNAALLDAFSPLKTLSRGYSIATKDNNIIKSIHQVQKQDALQLQVEDGCIHVSVTDKEEKELWHKKS